VRPGQTHNANSILAPEGAPTTFEYLSPVESDHPRMQFFRPIARIVGENPQIGPPTLHPPSRADGGLLVVHEVWYRPQPFHSHPKACRRGTELRTRVCRRSARFGP
jgi:hypothetical protein